MTFFHITAYLAPLIAGFAAAACLALTRERPLLRRLTWLGAAVGAALILPLGGGLFAGAFVPFLKLALLVGAFTLLVAGFFLILEACRVPHDAAQVLSGILVVALLGTIFWIKPVLDHAEASGMSDDAVDARITLALRVNPFAVTSYSILEQDPGHWRGLYPIGLDDFRHGYPRWGASALGYLLAGLALFGASLGIARVWRTASP